MNILITSSSGKISLLQAFQKALCAMKLEAKVVCCDTDVLSPSLYVADAGFISLRTNDPQYLNHLIEQCRRHQIQAILPTRDEELLFFSENREFFKTQGITVWVTDSAVIRTCQNKRLFNQWCLDHGFEIPHWNHTNYEKTNFPLCVRPVTGKGSNGMRKVFSRDQLDGVSLDSCVIQEWIEAPEYSVDVFCDAQSNCLSAVARLRCKVESGESVVSQVEDEPLIIATVKRLCSALKLTGVATIQAFQHEGRVLFIEVNPRFGGASVLSCEAGRSTPEYLLREASGQILEPVVTPIRYGLTLLRHSTHCFVDTANLFKSL
jgi:carbamoyl-phosphate synthase large subunit